MKPLHQRLNLYTEGDEAFTFVPAEPVGARSLTIQRATGEVSLNRPNNTLYSSAERYPKPVYGVLGLLSLSLSEYVIILTGRELRGRLMGHDVYRVTDVDILPLNPNVSVAHPPHPVENHLLALVRSHWQSGQFLFSYTCDLTRRLQAQWANAATDARKGMWEAVDDRFFWNRFLQSRFIESVTPEQDLSAFVLPVMYGSFDIRSAFIHGRHIQLCLISRRSRFRAGTRYFRRGIDQEGNVANFNETEQLLLVEGASNAMRDPNDFAAKLSFVQIRGSIPLYWAEINTLRYKPDLQIMERPDTANAMRLHLLNQVSTYGEASLVNLVNHKGHEKPVKEAFERYISDLALPQVKYQYFDFHTECKHMRWDRISILIEQLEPELLRQGYLHLDGSNSEPVKLQKGVVRTNCMDNLDRTNVVQAALAKWTLNKQLHSLGIIPENATIDEYDMLSRDFREMWADHADSISKAYGGSGALKTDFTRTNKRTKKGALDDGAKSIVRYLKNNYFDGARQDAFDLVTGNWIPRKNPSSALFLITDPRPLITRSMPVVAWFSLFMICAGLTLPRSSDYSLIYYFLIWLSVLACAATFIVLHGIDYVAWPRLIPPHDIIYYDGPGYRSAHHGKGIKGIGLGKHTQGRNDAKDRLMVKVPSLLGNGGDKKMDEIEMGTIAKKRVD